ncbi:MAG: hypothetical protein JWL70_2794, partial [Acidimicrobiia bacterium]|nr:hypothetical protein [Acidimicrobiia bacterium]
MNDDAGHTTPTQETKQIEELDAQQHRDAGRAPTPEEEAAAERGKSELTPEAAENYEEYLKKAANVQGEG